MEARLRFSLVVMTYERPLALRRCLESIRRLDFPKSAYEVIVVDDGSLHGLSGPPEVGATDLRLRYRWIPHRGVAAARNTGLAEASGELIAFLADDYAMAPDYLARADEFFLRYPEAQVLTFNVRSVASGPARHIQQIYIELVLLQNAAALPDENGIIRTFHLPASRAAVFRRQVFQRVGPFDERLTAGEDGELGQRLAAHGIPLHFMHQYYIDHHEEKSLREFLRQRREYATSYYNLRATSRPRPERPRWPLSRCVKLVLERLSSWVGLSRRHGKFLRFCVLSPGLALFLFRFYLTLHQLERSAARSTAASRPEERGDAAGGALPGARRG